MTNTYFDKELAKLEKQQKALREASPNDQYNSFDNPIKEDDYVNYIKDASTTNYQWKTNQKLQEYIIHLEANLEILTRNSIKAHIRGPKGAWKTHTHNPMGCFMCDDLNMIHYIFNHILKPLSKALPTLTPALLGKNPIKQV